MKDGNIGKIIYREDRFTCNNLLTNYCQLNHYKDIHLSLPKSVKYFTLRFILLIHCDILPVYNVFIKKDNEEIPSMSDNTIRLPVEDLEGLSVFYKFKIQNRNLLYNICSKDKAKLRVELLSIEF